MAALVLAVVLGLVAGVGVVRPALAQTPINLPAPVYLLDAPSGQIVRVANDGVTRRTVTHELAPVTSFDVSPDGSKLAYVAGNKLIEAQADGSGRVREAGWGRSQPGRCQAGAAGAQAAGSGLMRRCIRPMGAGSPLHRGGST